MEKQKDKVQKGCLTLMAAFFGIFIIIIVAFLIAGPVENNSGIVSNASINPLGIGTHVLDSLIGKGLPYEKYGEWGVPHPLEGTNSVYFLGYMEKSNIGIVYQKRKKKIILMTFGKEKVIEFLEERNKKIQSHFHVWDGAHIELEKLIIFSLNDPDSYKHVQTRYFDQGDSLYVITTYSAKNLFGGRLKQTVRAKVNLEDHRMRIEN